MRRRVTLVLALTIALLGLAVLPAVAGGPNHVVLATTTGQNAVQVQSGLQLASTGTNDFTSTNLARAYSHDCTGCRTIAVALQAVLVTGNPQNASPNNVAIALNENCNTCTTYAFAFQYTVSADRERLSPAARQAVNDLRAEAAAVANSDLPLIDINAKLEAIGARLKSTVDDDLKNTGDWHGDGTMREREDGLG